MAGFVIRHEGRGQKISTNRAMFKEVVDATAKIHRITRNTCGVLARDGVAFISEVTMDELCAEVDNLIDPVVRTRDKARRDRETEAVVVQSKQLSYEERDKIKNELVAFKNKYGRTIAIKLMKDHGGASMIMNITRNGAIGLHAAILAYEAGFEQAEREALKPAPSDPRIEALERRYGDLLAKLTGGSTEDANDANGEDGKDTDDDNEEG